MPFLVLIGATKTGEERWSSYRPSHYRQQRKDTDKCSSQVCWWLNCFLDIIYKCKCGWAKHTENLHIYILEVLCSGQSLRLHGLCRGPGFIYQHVLSLAAKHIMTLWIATHLILFLWSHRVWEYAYVPSNACYKAHKVPLQHLIILHSNDYSSFFSTASTGPLLS